MQENRDNCHILKQDKSKQTFPKCLLLRVRLLTGGLRVNQRFVYSIDKQV